MNSYAGWLRDLLGPDAADIVALFPDCIQEGHRRARDAQDVSRLRQKNPYGATLWMTVYEEFARMLGALPGASFYKPSSAPYKLVVINDTVVYPVRLGSTLRGTLRDTRMKVTPVRRSIASLSERIVAQQAFDFSEIGFGGELTVVAAADSAARRVLLVPFVASSEAGLVAAGVGQGELLGDGGVSWDRFYELDLNLYRAMPQPVVGEDAAHRFDYGRPPEPGLSPRRPGKAISFGSNAVPSAVAENGSDA